MLPKILKTKYSELNLNNVSKMAKKQIHRIQTAYPRNIFCNL